MGTKKRKEKKEQQPNPVIVEFATFTPICHFSLVSAEVPLEGGAVCVHIAGKDLESFVATSLPFIFMALITSVDDWTQKSCSNDGGVSFHKWDKVDELNKRGSTRVSPIAKQACNAAL